MIPESFINELKDALPIDSVIGSYVQLKRRGSNLVGLCPFHSEKTPSFTVHPDKGFFHCFGCGAGGDVITFVRRMENMEYVEAIEWLAGRAGMTVPEEDDHAKRAANLKLRILEINRAAARFFHETLYTPAGREGLEYLYRRGLTDAVIRRFGLGFAPNSWDALYRHLQAMGYTEYEMDAARITAQTRSGGRVDMFRNRAMFPIIDTRGSVVAFGARAMGDAQPKYLNTADTPVFHKSRNLFALNYAKNAAGQPFILAEGYMDVIAIHAAGFPSAVATLGTALTAEQARLLTNYTKEVILSYDSDEAGQKATRRAAALLDEVGLRVRVLRMEGAKDPDEFIQKFGANRFSNLIQQSAGAMEYQLSNLRNGRDFTNADDTVAYLKEAVALIAQMQSSLERDTFAGKVAETCGAQKNAVLEAVEAARRRSARREQREAERRLTAPPVARDAPVNPERIKHERAARCEDTILRALFFHPNLLAEYDSFLLSAEDFVTSFNRRVYSFMSDSLRAGRIPDLSAFSAAFTVEEVGALTGMFYPKDDVPANARLALDSIAVLRQEKANAVQTDWQSMSPEQIQQMLMQKRATTEPSSQE